ncbi:MAG: SRPBCC family protein [Arenicellales bacterium]|jgi:carbon-monoxide dehydrogenase small subunit|nr:SRPBCC family protein [Arenicellales bacterium]
MKIDNQFIIEHSPTIVWAGLSDIYTVAECLPGASVADALPNNRYRGRFAVKLGPLAATFEGELEIEHDLNTQSATVSGKGTDTRSSSRAQASLHYQLEPTDAGHTKVRITTNLTLTGALAQFGKAAVIQQVANRITVEFVAAFEQRLAQHPDATDTTSVDTSSQAFVSTDQPALNAGHLLLSVCRDLMRRWWTKLFHRP